MTEYDLIERLRLLEQDHGPDGWPAVKMRDITALLDALEAAREDASRAMDGLRYAVRVWVLPDEIPQTNEDIDAACERMIARAIDQARGKGEPDA